MSRLLSGIVLVAVIAWAGPCSGQPYPSRPIRLVVPFGPGGTTDVIARVVAQKLAVSIGPIVVENKPGAGGNIAYEYVANAAPNGYTLLAAHPALTINPSLYGSVGYNPLTSFAPVVLMAATPLLLAVHPSLPARNVRELIALAKKRPGELTFASAGNGSTSHLAGDMFRNMAGINVLHVPYKGAAPGMLDLVNGTMSLMINPLPEMLPFSQPGKIRALATTGKKRSPVVPDLPTIDEAGIPRYEILTWAGIVAPAGVPKEIIARLNKEIIPILQMPDVREQMMGLGYVILGSSPDEFAAYLKAETEKWAKVIKASGTKVE